MNKSQLPGTDLSVSQLCLGTNQFGTALDDAAADAILEQFAALGGNFVDTARSYGDWIPDAPRGASELALGRLLGERQRSDWVVATKGCEFDYRSGTFAPRVSPAILRDDLAASLEALQTDYIDLYWLHRDDPSQPVEALVDALIAEQQAGRIRAFGCSNWSVPRIEAAQAYAASIGHGGFSACQPMWGLAEPNRETAMMSGLGGYYEDGYQALHASGLAMIPYSGQSRGFFSKLAEGGEAALADDLKALYLNDANRKRLPVVQRIAAELGVSINQVALAYLLCQPHLTIPIIGASRAEQLNDTVAAAALQLTPAQLAELRRA